MYLYRIVVETDYIMAILRDYECGENPVIFTGTTDLGETVLAFVHEDGSAFVCIEYNTEGYIQFSNHMADGNEDWNQFAPNHPGVDEYTFSAGELDPTAKRLHLDTTVSL